MNGRRTLLALLVVALFVMPSSGCLDARTWKDLVMGIDKVKVGYHDVDGPSQYWAYDITAQDILDYLVSGNPDEPPTDMYWEYYFHVKKDSTRITLSFNLTMMSPDEMFWEEIEEQANGTGYEDYVHFLRTLERYLEVTLIDPGDNVEVNVTYTDTTDGDVQEFVLLPEPGRWLLSIKSRGYGGTAIIPGFGEAEYHDEFYVRTSIREAYYR
ncbi:MAG: hypothetical protein L0Z54_03030 [Thermoplasmata archaeon]|nr:hypothetical protein [Thermoplasmata archaeon]